MSFKFDIVDSCERGNAIKTLAMLKFGADANSVSSQDEPLLITVFTKVITMDSEAIGEAGVLGNLDRKAFIKILSGLVQYGADINSILGNEKMTPLHLSALAGNVDLLKWCLSQPKIQVDLKTPSVGNPSMTALMIAAKYDKPEVIAELVRFNANLEEKETMFNRTVLHVAASFGQTHICRLLLRLGSSPSAVDGAGNTAAKVADNESYHIT